VVLAVLNSFSRQSFLVSTNVMGALEVFLNDVRYINSRFTYLFINLQILTIKYLSFYYVNYSSHWFRSNVC